MENLLLQIVKDATAVKYAEVRTASQQVHDFLEAQQGSIRAQPHELRERCLGALQLALESHNSKLVSHALLGFQKLLRDDRFQSSLECESEEQWLPSQLLLAFGAIRQHSEDVQVELLRVLLTMACAPWWSVNESVILHVLHVCLQAYADGGAALRVAATATASQTLRAFSEHLRDQEHTFQTNPYLKSTENSEKGDSLSAYSNIIPIIQFLCKKLTKHPSNSKPKQRLQPFYLECLLSLFGSLSVSVLNSKSLQEYLWKEFVPTLVSLLGSPTTEKNAMTSSAKVPAGAESQTTAGRHLTSCPVLTSSESKTVYNIGVELVRIAGPYSALRPMLESMFHRMLLVTSPPHRLEALRAIKEIMKKPEPLINFGGPPVLDDQKVSCCTDLGLMKLAMDAFVECSHCSDVGVCYISIECVNTLLDSLERICTGAGMSPERTSLINSTYADLDSCDYQGPMTYQTWEKLQRLDRLQKSSLASHSELEDSESDDGPAKISCRTNSITEEEDVECESEDAAISVCAEMDDSVEPSCTEGATAEAIELAITNGVDTAIVEESSRLEQNDSSDVDGPPEVKDGERDGDPPSGYETDSSGSTEGPEEGFEDDQPQDERDDSAHNARAYEEAARRRRIPKSLLGEESGQAEQERVRRLYETRDLYAQQERSNARGFVELLGKVLPGLLAIKSSIEADEALQSFASKYCEDVMSGHNSHSKNGRDQSQHHMIVNADGIYLATYSALLLNLKLIQSGFYRDRCKDPPLTEEEFVENVHGSGVLVYLSAMWLAELYQQILQRDYLTTSGYHVNSRDNNALINLLADLEGLGKSQSGCHLLSDYSRLEKAATNGEDDPKVEAGRKFARRLLTGCWDGVLEVLSVLLNGKNAVGISASLGLMLGTEGAREEHRRARDAVALSLDGLQTAARLSNVLNLHSRCGAVFSVLATVSCPTIEARDEPSTRRIKLKSSVLLSKNRQVKLHSSHILSMDVILSRGLELGSHSPDCWKHIFRCCIYLADLEHSFFTEELTGSTTPKLTRKERESTAVKNAEVDELSGIDHTFSTVAMNLGEPAVNIADLIKKNASAAGSSGLLTHEQSVQVLCALSQQADRLFDDASYKLNLRSLLGFASALCSASQETLFAPGGAAANSGGRRLGSAATGLLHRVGDVMLKCVRSGRPLVHVMQVWSVVGLHLMEAACHQDQRVAKTAVTSIHDIVSALLGSQTELPYFHFNEALFKPFENLLCLELCDTDIQDQIIGSICEFVEACTTEICSGWRPLFGALRAVRAPAGTAAATSAKDGDNSAPLSSGHLRAVLDVFEAFLNTDNILVFTNAAVDCILCLLKHIKGESVSETDSQSLYDDDGNEETASTDLCLASLDYIHSCCTMLARMQQMDKCPIFHASNRINLCSPLQFVDAEILGRTIVHFAEEDEIGRREDEDESADGSERPDARDYCLPGNEVYVNEPEGVLVVGSACERLVTLDTLERPSGILHVWCLVLEGLAGAMATASRKYQSPTMKTLFDLLQKVYELPGVEFGLYVVNHLLLPMIQSWLRRTSKVHRGWDSVGSQFKQCCGQTTDLVVDYITKLAENDQLSSVLGVKLLLHQLFLVTTECIASPTESISRLGCSCIRHVIVSAGPLFTTDLWEVTCEALERAFHVSLFSARQLMVAFQPGSDNFYGDTGQVKVAAKSDCSPEENERLKQLAQQVFLLDNQRSDAAVGSTYPDEPIDDDRSYIFLLYPSDADPNLQQDVSCVKVPFRNLVVGLLSHQILLQIVGGVLLQGLPHIVPSLANILLQSPAPTPSVSGKKVASNTPTVESDDNEVALELPGTLNLLTQKQLFTLLGCLEHSYQTTCDFDCRPGLKFLVQKVARAHAAANLYKQAGASWTVHTVVLLELCLHCRPPERSLTVSSLPIDHPVARLRQALSRVCSRYARLLARKGDDCLDRLQDQPIFFLVAPLDDYMESRHRNGNDRPPVTPLANEVTVSDLQQPPTEERPPPEDGHDANAAQPDQDDRSPESARDALADLASSDLEDDDEEEDQMATMTAAGRGEGEGESDDTRVYHVATQRDIDSVFQEYKKRKHQHAMPSNAATSKKEKRRNPFDQPRKARAGPGETKLPSVLKDHEAHVKVYTEMILSIFDFVCQLDDAQFRGLLPSLFPFVRTLVAHANDATLRQTLAEMLDRVASLYHFGASE